jgi:hypothetical protein
VSETKSRRRRVIRNGDLLVCHYTEEMETKVCGVCLRPFMVGAKFVKDVRARDLHADRIIYCPAGHRIALKGAA